MQARTHFKKLLLQALSARLVMRTLQVLLMFPFYMHCDLLEVLSGPYPPLP